MKLPGSGLFTVALLACASAATTGCGGTLYAISASSASNRVEEAKALGAEKLAPYEYYYARENLTKAMSEAAEGDYSDAIDFAEEAEKFGAKAAAMAREAHRGAGR